MVGKVAAALSSCVAQSATALFTASPRMVCEKLLLLMSKAPPPPLYPLPPPPPRNKPEREDSPLPVTEARISPVVVLTRRAVMATTALDSFLPAPASTPVQPLRPPATPPTLLSSRPNLV